MQPAQSSFCVAFGSLALLSACGAGTAVAVSGGSSGGDGNAPAAIANFAVLDAQVPALCRVEFLVRDAEGDPTEVELLYSVPGQPEQRITHIAPIAGVPAPPANPGSLASSASGVQYAFQWDFAAEALLPDDGGFVEGARVIARLDGASALAPSSNTHAGIGNDPPEVIAVHAPKDAEVVGIAAVPLTVADSSSDAVSIQVEYDIVGDLPDAGWRLARPAGLPAGASTPEFAFSGVIAPAELGVDLVFFWNTNVDLLDLEHDVVLRFTPSDAVVAGASASTPTFHVDNNAAPIATISGDLLLLNTDQRRGIPIPFTLIDEESDDVELVFQWRHASASFPELPANVAELRAILDDPEERRARHICSRYRTSVGGFVAPLDSTSVRLPELVSSASEIVSAGIEGLELQLLRASSIPTPIASTWSANPLSHPVAVLPLSDGIEAVVLDRAAPGAWRLRQIDLATGVVTRELVASSSGEPNTMAFESDETSVLVASDIGGLWRVSRVDLAANAEQTLIAADVTSDTGAIRAVTSLGRHSALITAGDSLIRLRYGPLEDAQATTLFDDLATPWGLALDPLDPNHVYVAEHDAVVAGAATLGRILSIDLPSRARRALQVGALDPAGASVRGPESLALDRTRDRLLVVSRQSPGAERRLLGIEVGRAPATTFDVRTDAFASTVGSIATGPDGSVVMTLTSADDLAIGGGVEQSRTIESYDRSASSVRVNAAFSPSLQPLERWRIAEVDRAFRTSPTGRGGVFVWDSSDVLVGGDVLLRAVPLDSEIGISGSTAGAKRTRHALDSTLVSLGSSAQNDGVSFVTAGDIDGDGDVDLASANSFSNTLSVFFQTNSGTFAEPPLVLGSSESTGGAACVALADLDGDGDVDLASANAGSNTLTIFFQLRPGVFEPGPLTLGDTSLTSGAASVAAADLDGDGDMDLVSANSFSDTLTIFFQTNPGVFARDPLGLGNSAVTDTPQCVTPADIDGDGDIDLVAASFASDGLAIFFQTSPGVFAPEPLILGNAALTNGARSVAAIDLDGDGHVDLVSANQVSDTLTVFLQTSRGAFAPQPLVLGSTALSNGPFSVTAADVDSDGDLDLVSANALSDTLTVFFQSSAGVFEARPLVLATAFVADGFASLAAVTATDLDADGDLDLVSANRALDSLAIWFQESPGGFGPDAVTLGSSPVTDEAWTVACADLDADGDVDLVSANGASDTLTVFLQTSRGIFATEPQSLGNASVTNGARSVAAADLDGDGDIDLASANSISNTLTVFFQSSPGVFTPNPIVLGDASVTNGAWSIAAADLDGDGDNDLASTSSFGDTLAIFFQTSPGVFALEPVRLGDPSVTDLPRGIAAADLDGDGDIDLVSANAESETLTVFFQTSPGVFASSPLSLEVGVALFAVAAGDLDGDGDLDLVSGNAQGNTLSVFFQTSAGVFARAPLVLGDSSTTANPLSVAIADLDGDGDNDLVSANNSAFTLTVFFQRAPGVFVIGPTSFGGFPTTNQPASVVASDLDGDGDVDLVSTNRQGDDLTIFWGTH